ncbi:ComF family protein [Candidatus Uhrbacteria bacterium]|nr:ComF family protein [Candidatus Uhrbacteria bacterium]
MSGSLTGHIGNRVFNTISAALLDIFFPRFCLGCNMYGVWVCDACRQKLPRYMPRPLYFVNYTAHLSAIRAAYSYDHWLTRSIVHTCKYQGIRDLAAIMASALAHELSYIPTYDQECLLIPVPLHESKLRERGFNQAELIATRLAGMIGAQINTNAVARVRSTRTQVTLNRKQRKENVRQAFACVDPLSVAGRKIILIDDISTTGSTLSELAGIVRSSGAVEVSGLVFAHGTLPNVKDRALLVDHPTESFYYS